MASPYQGSTGLLPKRTAAGQSLGRAADGSQQSRSLVQYDKKKVHRCCFSLAAGFYRQAFVMVQLRAEGLGTQVQYRRIRGSNLHNWWAEGMVE